MIYFISGGGTAGHIYPAISIADSIRKIDENAKFYYVGIKGKLEEEIAKKEGYEFLPVTSMPLILKPSIKAIKSLNSFIKGVKTSKQYIDKYHPDAIICTGGYVSGPIGYTAKLKKIPLYIHESNAYPGITTNFLDRFSKITFLPYESVKENFKNKKNKVVAGTPIRSQFNMEIKDENHKLTVLSFGGSGGQKSLNEAVGGIFTEYKDFKYDWIHICGRNWEKEFHELVPELPKYATVYTYYYEFYELMKKADLVICGCGAQTLNEVSAMKKPSVLIPKMNVVKNHQYFNAKKYEDENAGVLIKETDLNKDILLEVVDRLMNDREKLKTMGENAGHLFVKDSADIIAKNIYEDLKK